MNQKRYTHGFCAIALLIFAIQAQFPYNITFNSTTPYPNILLPSGAGTNQATFTNDGLRLTSNAGDLFGAVIFDAVPFSPSNGMDIEFEYVMYESGSAFYGAGDGLCSFFLMEMLHQVSAQEEQD